MFSLNDVAFLAAVTAPSGVVATGGDSVTDITVGGISYRVHQFTTVGTSTFTVTAGGEIEYLVAAGGGGGGFALVDGGGGAGGLLKFIAGESNNSEVAPLSIVPSNYSISVGDGGIAGFGSGEDRHGRRGQNSSAFNLTAIGGGGGVGSTNTGTPEKDGGSGGGGRSGSTIPLYQLGGSGTAGQGFKGGDDGGGGGGAAGAGNDGANGGSGGPGVASSISGSSITYSIGGSVGSGVISNANKGQGGASTQAGGSGIVIIRYRI